MRCHYVINTINNFHFLDNGEKLSPVFLLLEVGFLNKYISVSIKTSRLVMCSKILKAEVLLPNGWQLCLQGDNSLENVQKLCVSMWTRYFLLVFFLFLFVSSYLVYVVPWSTIWTFSSNVKTLTLPWLLVTSISLGAMNSISKSFINSSSSLLLCTASNNVNTWPVEVLL